MICFGAFLVSTEVFVFQLLESYRSVSFDEAIKFHYHLSRLLDSHNLRNKKVHYLQLWWDRSPADLQTKNIDCTV